MIGLKIIVASRSRFSNSRIKWLLPHFSQGLNPKSFNSSSINKTDHSASAAIVPHYPKECSEPMEGDRKYKQHGYQDTEQNDTRSSERPRSYGPRLPIDITGPRLPRLVQTVTASRCYSCGVTLPQDVDFKGTCPKCAVALHCCKQCTSFEPSTRFQCRKPIQVRIAVKDAANECTSFSPRVTVARDVAPPAPQRVVPATIAAPRTVSDARAAFDQLFKK